MAEAEQNKESSHVSIRMNGFRGDLLQKFTLGNHFARKFEEKINDDEEQGEIELSLGLSLNGRFGVDPKRAKNLVRSSSITNIMITSDENRACTVPVASYTPITRTCSLPTEEEWRKRKELQSQRRMEAKRRRLEKLKNVKKMVRDKVDLDENCEENGQNGGFSTANWVSGAVGGVGIGHGIESKGESGNDLGSNGGLLRCQPSSQGSIGSQGCGSTVISDFESQPIQGTSKHTELRSPASYQSLPEQIEQKLLVTVGMTNGKPDKFTGAVPENPPTKTTVADKDTKKLLRNVMADMPCVSTTGDGPNGKSIEGFLYRYRKGEEVKIVCVCHGSFLSPAEFVRHAGGGDVQHPLRHIVINPSPIL